MGAPTDDAAVPDHLRAGEPGLAPSVAGSVGWPVPVGFSLGLASAALVLAIATAVVTIADGDLFIISLVPGLLAAALIGGVVAVRRAGHPMGTLLCAYGLAGAVCVAAFAYARLAVVHSPRWPPFGVPVMWMTSWDFAPSNCFGALVFVGLPARSPVVAAVAARSVGSGDLRRPGDGGKCLRSGEYGFLVRRPAESVCGPGAGVRDNS